MTTKERIAEIRTWSFPNPDTQEAVNALADVAEAAEDMFSKPSWWLNFEAIKKLRAALAALGGDDAKD